MLVGPVPLSWVAAERMSGAEEAPVVLVIHLARVHLNFPLSRCVKRILCPNQGGFGLTHWRTL